MLSVASSPAYRAVVPATIVFPTMNYYRITADLQPLTDSETELTGEDEGADPNWLVVKASTSASTLPSANKVNDDDLPIVRKMDEIFETILPSAEAEADTVVRRRPSKAKTYLRQRRTLNTVSGYFSDWAKWLTEGHPSWGLGNPSMAAEVDMPQPRNGYSYDTMPLAKGGGKSFVNKVHRLCATAKLSKGLKYIYPPVG